MNFFFKTIYLFLSLPEDILTEFRERGMEGGRGEKHPSVASHKHLNRDSTGGPGMHNLGVCPDWESDP